MLVLSVIREVFLPIKITRNDSRTYKAEFAVMFAVDSETTGKTIKEQLRHIANSVLFEVIICGNCI